MLFWHALAVIIVDRINNNISVDLCHVVVDMLLCRMSLYYLDRERNRVIVAIIHQQSDQRKYYDAKDIFSNPSSYD